MSLRKKKHQPSLLSPVTRDHLDAEFQRSFYESAVRIDPNNLECLIQLGDLYSRRGQYEKGLEIDARLVELCPQESIFHYNLACSYSRLNQHEEALVSLRKAIQLGFEDLDSLQNDEDLETLRLTAGFQQLMKEFLTDPQV